MAGRAAPRLLADGRACVPLQRVQAAVGGGTTTASRLTVPSLPLSAARPQQRDVTQADLDTLRERHLARCDTDSWLYSPLLLAIFDIPVADAVVRATALARAACERCEVGLWENLVQGYRAVYAEIGLLPNGLHLAARRHALGLGADASCSRLARAWDTRASASASSAYVDVHHQEALLDFTVNHATPDAIMAARQAAGTGPVELLSMHLHWVVVQMRSGQFGADKPFASLG